MRSKSQGIFVC